MKSDWQKKKLREVCELINGRAYSKPELLSEGKYPVLRVGNFFTNNHWYYSNLELEEKKYCDSGDLLYAWSASFGPRTWAGGKVIFHYHIWKVIPNAELIDQKFLFHFFLWDTEQIKKDQGAGTTMIHVSKGSMEDRDLLLPPLPDQQRIVAILDEAFDGIAKARINAKKNLQNARELFESHLQSIFAQRGEGWIEKPLGELCELISGQHIDAKDYNTKSRGVAYLTGPSDFGAVNPVITKWTEYPKRMAIQGDILITVKGSGVGKVNILDIEGIAISRQLMAIRAKAADAGYLYAFISAKFSHFQSLATGAAIPGISREDVLNLMCPMPPPAKQPEVLNFIHLVQAATQRLESIYQQKLAALDELKKSLLHKAFAGEL